jgi:drug/metabolite transporter (DMT)-like permease
MNANSKRLIATITAFAAIYIIWGTTYLFIRIAVETMPPFLMAGSRFLVAGLLSFLFLRWRGVARPRRIEWRSAAIIGFFLLFGGNGMVTWSEQQVPSGIAALVVAAVPIWMTLFDTFGFSRTRPGKQTILGLALGLLGIVLLIGPGQILGTASFGLTSLLVLLLADIMWSVGSLYSRQAALPDNVFMSTSTEMLVGGGVLLLAGLFTGEAAAVDIASISARSLFAWLYLTVFGSLVAFTAYVWLLKHVRASHVATYTYVNPVIAVFLGWLVLDETITWQTLVAVVVILTAVVLVSTERQKGQPAVNEPDISRLPVASAEQTAASEP